MNHDAQSTPSDSGGGLGQSLCSEIFVDADTEEKLAEILDVRLDCGLDLLKERREQLASGEYREEDWDE